MLKLLGLTACLLLFSGASAQAASLPYEATLKLTVGSFPAFGFAGSGVGTSDGGPGSNASIPGLPVATIATLASPVSVIAGFGICAPGVPLFTNISLPPAGTSVPSCSPLTGGALDAITFDGASGTAIGGFEASVYLITTFTNNTFAEIPLAVVGVGGTEFFRVEAFSVDGSITGNPWTTGSVSVMYQLITDAAPGTLSAQGSDERNADGTGRLRLVTSALADLGSFAGTVGAVAELEINYVPEPGTLSLVGLGLIGLSTARRRCA